MSKKIIYSIMTAVSAVAIASQAVAADLPPSNRPAPPAPIAEIQPYQWYLRGDAGIGFTENIGGNDVDETYVVGGGFGMKFTDMLRFDVTADYQGEASIDGPLDDVSIFSALANVYVDLPNSTIFTPYVGAGAGYANVKVEPGSSSDEFAWAATGGVAISFAPNVDLDVNYRYLDAGRVSGQDIDVHQIRAGLRYNF